MKDTIKFFPLLGIYIFIVLTASTNTFKGDESRYVLFANNLSQGFYSSLDSINLWNGPGYSIILLPFVIFKSPWIMAKLLNALFLFFGVVYFYKALRLYIPKRHALYFTYIMGLYPPMLVYPHLLVTESFAFFLVFGFLFHFLKFHNNGVNKKIHFIMAAFYLGYFLLTKVYYSYIVLTVILFVALLYFFKRKAGLKNLMLICISAIIICLPYFCYTYSLTGKFFYPGNAGGMSLYWMSTSYNNEFGDWHAEESIDEYPELVKNHKDFFKDIEKLDSVKKDEALKKRGMSNIGKYPGKFFKNWLANIGRMLFSYPFSYTYQKLTTFFYLIPNMFIVVISFLLIYPSYKASRMIPDEIWAVLMLAFIAFLGSSLVSAYSRQFSILVPIVIFWIAFTIAKLLKIEINK